MSHPFGELLALYRTRKRDLSQAKLARIIGYDPAVIARMAQGTRDLTGPSGRARIVRIIRALHDEGAIRSMDEANALLAAADMPPLYAGLPIEAALIQAFTPTPALASSPMLASRHGVPHNLPALLTSFVGREPEINELAASLPTTRLLTLTGSGGIGKSRLAQQLASEILNHEQATRDFADGVWLVQLAPINEATLVTAEVAAVLGLRAVGRSIQDVLLAYLQDKRVWLILDNCEHLIQICAELTEAVLHTCPQVRILATSREPLNIAGEVTWRVPSLTNEMALHLFADRARTARPDIRLDAQDTAQVARICERLDGIPLAIELAAARLRAYSTEQIATRLDDRFRLLTGGSRTALPRHRTLKALIDWSYGLLSDQERASLQKVSVFAGGWTLELAEPMLGSADALDVLATLVMKSLINANDTELGTRYSLHETIRQYAHEKLVESGVMSSVQRQHADACLARILWVKEHLRFTDQRRWVAVLETEHDNIRAALAWSLSESGDPGTGLSIAAYTGEFWLQSHRMEGREWTRRALEKMPDTMPLEIRGLAMLQYGYLNDATPSESRSYFQQLREMYAREDPQHAYAIEILGNLALLAETAETSTALLDEALALSRKSSHPDARYWIWLFVGLHLGPTGWKHDIEGAQVAFENLLAEAIKLRDTHGQVGAYQGMMTIAFYKMDLTRTADLAKQTLMLAEQVNVETAILSALHCLAELRLIENRWEDARSYIDVSHTHNQKYGYLAASAHAVGFRMRLALATHDYEAFRTQAAQLRQYVSMQNVSVLFGLEALAIYEHVEGRTLRAAQVFGAIEADRERCRNVWWPKDHAQLDDYISAMRSQLGDDIFATAWAKGRAMMLSQVIDLLDLKT